MIYRVLFLWVLVFSTFTKANVNPETISPLIDSYVRLNLDFDNIKKTCSDYGYKIFQSKTEKRHNGITIIDWMVVDRIGNKTDQRFFTFQTTNLNVTAMFLPLDKPSDWEENLNQCKARNTYEPISRQ